jgi:hypothetical protein
MSLPQTLFESPTGLIHLAGLLKPTTYNPEGSATTQCGRDVNLKTWTRIRMYDQKLQGLGPRSMRRLIDSAQVCDRCFK